MLKKGIIIALSVVLIISISLIVSYFILNKSQINENRDFLVSSGMSGYQVASKLVEEKIISNDFLFKLKLKLNRGTIQSGLYELEAGDRPSDIYSKFVEGQVKLAKIIIPEGVTISVVAKILNESHEISKSDFDRAANDLLAQFVERGILPNNANTLEGLLYPDTYKIAYGSSAKQILEVLTNEFFEKTNPYKGNFSSLSFYRKIILASIVEKEYRDVAEAPLIASVFQNRLNINMPLQSCATVVYVLKEILGRPHPKRLFYVDLEISSPYNTYGVYGLPPAPICSPSKIALDAVFNIPETEYLYFVVKDSAKGTHNFTSSLSDHQKAKEEYLIQNFK